jgi:hypothetical protein
MKYLCSIIGLVALALCGGVEGQAAVVQPLLAKTQVVGKDLYLLQQRQLSSKSCLYVIQTGTTRMAVAESKNGVRVLSLIGGERYDISILQQSQLSSKSCLYTVRIGTTKMVIAESESGVDFLSFVE